MPRITNRVFLRSCFLRQSKAWLFYIQLTSKLIFPDGLPFIVLNTWLAYELASENCGDLIIDLMLNDYQFAVRKSIHINKISNSEWHKLQLKNVSFDCDESLIDLKIRFWRILLNTLCDIRYKSKTAGRRNLAQKTYVATAVVVFLVALINQINKCH